MGDRLESEEEWSESELFFEQDNPLQRAVRLEDTSDSRREASSVSPAPEQATFAFRPAIKVHADAVEELGPSSGEEGFSETSRYFLAASAEAVYRDVFFTLILTGALTALDERWPC